MYKNSWKTSALWILIPEAVGALAAWLLRDDIRLYGLTVIQPRLAPPAIVFPIVWTLLYGLMGWSAARVFAAPASGLRRGSLRLYWLQLAVNFLWSFLFFRSQAFGLAFFWLLLLWSLILAMILRFQSIDRLAAQLQLPYLLWVTLAAVLNLRVWTLNG